MTRKLKFILLEERIVLDAAVAHDVIEASAPQTDIHLLVVANDTPDAMALLGTAKPGVEVVVYDPKTVTLDTLNTQITQSLHGKKAASIGFIGEGAPGAFALTKELLVTNDSLAKDGDMQQFWQVVAADVQDNGSIDFLACNIAAQDKGAQFLSTFSQQLSLWGDGISIGASSDLTGNPASGGNWIMETTNVDAAARYFETAALAEWDHVFPIFRPFTARVNLSGQLTAIGNGISIDSSITQPGEGIPTAVTTSYIDVDGDVSTFNSSSARLEVPVSSTIEWAGLYWSGHTGEGTPNADLKGSIMLYTPDATGYLDITASTLDTSSSNSPEVYYQGFADVTALVSKAGGGFYTVANLQTVGGIGNMGYGGWTLAVIYHTDETADKNVTILDGYSQIDDPLQDIPTDAVIAAQTGIFSRDIYYKGFLGFTTDGNIFPALSPGINMTPNPLTTSEDGTSANFFVTLNSQPTSDVLLAIAPTEPGEGLFSTDTLLFNADNWGSPQMVTVTGINDAVNDADKTYLVATASTSSDSRYNGLTPAVPLQITNQDNDLADIKVTPLVGLSTTEAGGAADFHIVLNSQPLDTVTLAFASDNPLEGVTNVSEATFDASNWNVAQTVTVIGQDDFVADGSSPYAIVNIASSADPLYNAIDPADVFITNLDNDVAGISINKKDVVTTEDGGFDIFTVVLDSQPLMPVTMPLSLTNQNEAVLSTTGVDFTPNNWNSPQTVLVTGLDDVILDGNQPYTIITQPGHSGDPHYNGISSADLAGINIDNDVLEPVFDHNPIFLVDKAAAGMDNLLVVPNNPVQPPQILPLMLTEQKEASLLHKDLTPIQWDKPQSELVKTLKDPLTEPHKLESLTTIQGQNLGAFFKGTAASDITEIYMHKDATYSARILEPPTKEIKAENGSSAEFSIALSSTPTIFVNVGLHSSDARQDGGLLRESITFNPATWNFSENVAEKSFLDSPSSRVDTETFWLIAPPADPPALHNDLLEPSAMPPPPENFNTPTALDGQNV